MLYFSKKLIGLNRTTAICMLFGNIYIVLSFRNIYKFYFSFIYTERLAKGTDLNSNKPESNHQLATH